MEEVKNQVVNDIDNPGKIQPKSNARKEKKPYPFAYERDKDRQKVRGIFRFHELPGFAMEFCYKKYEGDEVETYNLMDGEVYELPLGVAKHLNHNIWYPVHSYQMGEGGKHVQKIGRKVRRCSFQSLEFVDEADLTPVGESLITVERML